MNKNNNTGNKKSTFDQKQIFLSYASENLDFVRKIYTGLKKRNLNVWFDKEHLRAGGWKAQVLKAINRSRYFLICISTDALRKTGDECGFQDEELNWAYNIAQNQPNTDFSIVPIRIEECGRGDTRLTSYMQYDVFDDFEISLDKLAQDLGGRPLNNVVAKEEILEDETTIKRILGHANAAYYAGDYRNALTLCEAIEVINDKISDAWITKGVVFCELNKKTEALQAFDRAISIRPNNVIGLLNKGIFLCQNLGKYEEGIATINKSLLIDPNYYLAWLIKGKILLSIKDYENAIEAYNKVISVLPDYSFAWFEKGVAHSCMGHQRKAFEAFDKVTSLDAKNAKAWHFKGITLNELGHYDEALAAYDRTTEIESDDYTIWYDKGCFLVKRGLLDDALKAFGKAISIDVQNVDAWFMKGFTDNLMGCYEDALDSFNKVLAIDPDNHRAWYQKAIVLFNLKRNEEWQQAITKAIEIEPNYKSNLITIKE
jgi:tetratricopeptide (TPR) repeat protein